MTAQSFRGLFEEDASPAGKIGELLFVQERGIRTKNIVLGLVFGDGSFRNSELELSACRGDFAAKGLCLAKSGSSSALIDQIGFTHSIADPSRLGCVQRSVIDLNDVGRANSFYRQACLESRDGPALLIEFHSRANDGIRDLAEHPCEAASSRIEFRVRQQFQVRDNPISLSLRT